MPKFPLYRALNITSKATYFILNIIINFFNFQFYFSNVSIDFSGSILLLDLLRRWTNDTFLSSKNNCYKFETYIQ